MWPEAMLFFTLAFGLMLAWGFPNHPVRGTIAMVVDIAVIFLILVPFLGLLFYLVDATRGALILAKDLAKPVTWPSATLKSRNVLFNPRDPACLSQDPVLLDVELVGAATEPVGNLVWYPILVLTLIALARLPFFDAWTIPPPLLIVMALTLTYAVVSAWRLRQEAEKVRASAIRELKQELRRLRTEPTHSKEELAFIEEMLSEVKANETGAFRPFSRQPVVQALLTLASSLTGVALVQYTTLFSF